MAFDANLFGQAAAEVMTLRLGEVTKTQADYAARIAALEKLARDLEKENAAIRERLNIQQHDVRCALDDIEVAVNTVESLKPEKGERGEKGADGVDGRGIADAMINADGDLVLTFTDGSTKSLGRVTGERGEKGADGAQGAPGKDGAPGAPGADGSAGKDGENGRDGRDGKDGEDGRDGAPGERGEKGERGDGVKDAIIDNAGNLILTFTDGSTKSLGRVVGESFSDFAIEYLPDTHEIAMRATCAGVTKSLRYPAGGIRALGYWRDGKSAKAGEAVSLGGCLYIAKVDTKAKPTYDHPDWFLAVQRGRDMTEETKKIQRNPSEKSVPLVSAGEGAQK